MEAGRELPVASPRRSTRRCAALERRAGKTPRRPGGPAAGLGALRARGCRCRGCSTRCSTSASTTTRSPGSPRSTGERAVRLGLLPALRADVRQRRARDPAVELRAGAAGGEGPQRASSADTGARRRGAARADRDLQAPVRGGDRRRLPAEPREQLRQAITAVFDSWDGERARRLPPDQRHPRRLGHRGQRPADGLRQPGRHARAPASPSAATSAPESRPRRATSCPTPRARTSSPAPATRRTSRRWPTACPRPTPSSCATSRGSSPTTRTCRTSSSRSRRVVCSCSRPAPPSAPRRPPSASPSTPCAEGLLTREEALLTIDAEALEALLHPVFDPSHEFEVLTTGVAASPGAARGRDRAQRRRRRCAARPTART